MTKHSEEADRLEALLQTLFPDEATASVEEVSSFLEAVDSDIEGLRVRLATVARDLAAAERRQQQPAPPYLQRVIDAMENPDSLPKDPVAAGLKAKEKLAALMQRLRPAGPLRVVEAYRMGDGELTKRDKDVLDRESDELLQEVEADDETE